MTIPRLWRDLARHATAAGWTIRRTRRGHLVWIGPDGLRLVTGSTPGDRRATRNHRAALRRAGLKVRDR